MRRFRGIDLLRRREECIVVPIEIRFADLQHAIQRLIDHFFVRKLPGKIFGTDGVASF